MSEHTFKLSFILPHRESDDIDATVSVIRRECASLDLGYEIISASGNNPTVQRNRCVEQAVHPWIYFVDNDSTISSAALKRAIEILRERPDTAVLGGPALTPSDNSPLQHTFAAVFSSPLAVGALSSRYSARGQLRETDDSELILCNMLVSREIFTAEEGFNELLYPNEENEFIHRVKEKGHKVLYAPDVFVYKDQRETTGQFFRQLFTYGRGRAEQTRIVPGSFKAGLLIPSLFFLYIMLLGPFLASVAISGFSLSFARPGEIMLVMLLPLALYILLDLAALIGNVLREGRLRILFPFFFFINHFNYGMGFIYGMLKRSYQAARVTPVCNIKKLI